MGQSQHERHALVTGGAKGIGAAIATALVREGVRVVVADTDAAAVEHLATRIGVHTVRLDVTDVAAVQAAVSAHGPFDILVNNAGMDQHAFFTDTTSADWQALLAVNLVSVFACTRAVLPTMQAAGFGRIINIASEAGRSGSRGGAVYAAAKGGVIAFTKSIARENARYGITANAVAPGPIETPMLENAIAAGGGKLRDAMANATLMRRLGRPEDIAAAVVYLASEAAGYVTGETLGVSGGMGVGAV